MSKSSSSSPPSGEHKFSLSAAQEDFVYAVARGESVLLLGEAGTGKSKCIAALGPHVQVTATTGVASASLAGAVTLHKFLGIRPPPKNETESFLYYWNLIGHNRTLIEKLILLRALVIDEVSMLHGRFVLILDLLLRKARSIWDVPFGGVQMILVGDFLQLPPVVPREDPWKQLLAFEVFKLIGFAPRRFDLLAVFRQLDPSFVTAIHEARNGKLGQKSLDYFRACEKTIFPNDGIKPTIVFQTNRSVDAENERCMTEAPDSGVTRRVLFRAHTLFADACFDVKLRAIVYQPVHVPQCGPQAEKRMMEYLDGIAADMFVRTGMQVIFRYNVDPLVAQVANGTCGLVVGWMCVNPDVYGVVTLVPVNSEDVQAPHVLPDPHAFPAGKDAVVVPVVRIARTGQFYAVHPHTAPIVWDPHERSQQHASELKIDENGDIVPLSPTPYRVLLVRRLPFVAGWALTVHRVQGLTLDRVELRIEVAAGKIPPPASYYVVFSRVRSVSCLKVTGKLEARHFWNSYASIRHFGDRAARQASGKVWDGPDLTADHIARVEYANWKKDMENSFKPSFAGKKSESNNQKSEVSKKRPKLK